MNIDQEDLIEMAQLLGLIIDDLPFKAKDKIESVIKKLETNPDSECLFKIQEELEIVSHMSNLDSFSRNEIMNVIAGLDGLVNN